MGEGERSGVGRVTGLTDALPPQREARPIGEAPNSGDWGCMVEPRTRERPDDLVSLETRAGCKLSTVPAPPRLIGTMWSILDAPLSGASGVTGRPRAGARRPVVECWGPMKGGRLTRSARSATTGLAAVVCSGLKFWADRAEEGSMMGKSTRAGVCAIAAAALMLGVATPVMAGTASGGTDGWNVEVRVPDWTVDSPTDPFCQRIPVTISSEGWGAGYLRVDMEARHELTPTGTGTSTLYFATQGENVDDWVYTQEMQVCPSLSAQGKYAYEGKYVIEGTAEYGREAARISTTFTVSLLPSRVNLNPIASNGDAARISGRATTVSPTLGLGGVGESAPVAIQQYVNGAWVHLTSLWPDANGYFGATFTGVSWPAPFRAVFVGDWKVAQSVSPTVTAKLPPPPRPTPPPEKPRPKVSVSAKAVSKGSKLKVDVNPNKGSGYWTFQVQKKVGSRWVGVQSYKTKGSKETRTVNLPKGTYRVVVNGKYGYASNKSASVYLRK